MSGVPNVPQSTASIVPEFTNSLMTGEVAVGCQAGNTRGLVGLLPGALMLCDARLQLVWVLDFFCCFTLKLPSPILVTRTAPSHLAQALLRSCSGNDQRNR